MVLYITVYKCINFSDIIPIIVIINKIRVRTMKVLKRNVIEGILVKLPVCNSLNNSLKKFTIFITNSIHLCP